MAAHITQGLAQEKHRLSLEKLMFIGRFLTSGFRFRVWGLGLGFRVLGFRGSGVQGLGFRV